MGKVMSDQKPAGVTRIARRRALPGREAEYEAEIRAMFQSMARQPGFRGADLLPPDAPGGEYQVIARFECESALQGWDQSPERQRHHAALRKVSEGEPAYRVLSGLEAWFAPAVVPAGMQPPRSRMSVVTWLGIFPVVSLYLGVLGPYLASWPFLLRTALITGLVVATMTWVVMPRLGRLFRPWLQRP